MRAARPGSFLTNRISLYSLMKTTVLLIIASVLAAVPGLSRAQQSMIVEHYTQTKGLPSNIVYSELKDKDGFMWFGTWHGLCSFDGVSFTSYVSKTAPSSDFPPRKVRDMLEDKAGNLWICNTDNHLFVFSKTTETFRDTHSTLKQKTRNVQVIKIQLMSNGHVLALTRSKELLEIYVGTDSGIHVNKIYGSPSDIDTATFRLRRNVFGENGRYVYWLDTRLNMDVVVKPSKHETLPKTQSRYTCFSHAGAYVYAGTEDGDLLIARSGARQKPAMLSFSGITAPVNSIDVIGETVYFTSGGTLYSYRQGESPAKAAAVQSPVVQTYVDKCHKLWLYSRNGQLTCYDPSARQAQRFALPKGNILSNIKFADGGRNGMFFLLKNGEAWRYDHRSGLLQNLNRTPEFSTFVSNPHYYDIEIDPDGILWLSSMDSGIFKVGFPRDNFKLLFAEVLQPKAAGEDDAVRAVYQDRRGDLWVGTRYGCLLCIDLKTGKVKRRFGKSEVGVVYHIMEDRRGRYWFSTKGAGLVVASPDPSAPQQLRLTRHSASGGDKSSLSSDRVYYTFEDSRGRVWVCTFNGGLNMAVERDGKTLFVNKRNGFAHYPAYGLFNDVRAITEDDSGRIWAGTTDGLMSFSADFSRPEDIRFETYREHQNNGTTGNDILNLYKDHAGRVWMGIFGNGLNLLERYDSRAHRPVLRRCPLSGGAEDVITSITEDRSGRLWISTEKGLASLRHGSAYVSTYDIYAGLPDVYIEENTSVCLNDGRILIGTRQGLLALNPSEVRSGSDRRVTFITAFKVANRDLRDYDPPMCEGALKYAEKVTLRHNLSTFTIEFAAPYYADNTLIQYAYMLDGYDKAWHNSGSGRVASYANVPPGKYKFRVKVNDGVSPERTLEVVITPPWWATWWAYALYALLALLALYGALRLVAYMIRMRNEVYINDRLAELKIRFFTNVSHELRTPLALIKGPVEELKANERLSAAGREYVDLIDRNANKMLRLVNQILDFRKVQNGKMRLRVSYTDMGALARLIARDFSLMAAERRIGFAITAPEGRVMAWCDAEKIGVVLNNLLSNAFKFTADGGRISLALSEDAERRTCLLRVEDNGADIPKAQLEQIFERFSQAANKAPENAASPGTGIGLALSREFVNMHNGRIWAENIAGGGVAFSVELPAGRDNFASADCEVCFDDDTAAGETSAAGGPADGSAGAAALEPQGGQGADLPAVMLIEDNTDMCRMLQLKLRTEYAVFTAHDGEEGLRAVYDRHPDLIITDLMMPGIDGMELLRRVRQDFSISHIPVIVLTAKNAEEDKMQAVRAGANAFITKPFSSSYLMARVAQLLDEQRVFQRKMVARSATEARRDDGGDGYASHLVRKDIEFVERIRSVIEQNLNASDFNIDAIAETIGLSRSAFFKKLKSLTGLAPVDLVKEIRLAKAERLVVETDDSMAEIAYAAGFHDAGYFGKCFRKKFGMTPKEYRAAKNATRAE